MSWKNYQLGPRGYTAGGVEAEKQKPLGSEQGRGVLLKGERFTGLLACPGSAEWPASRNTDPNLRKQGSAFLSL
eukprot:11027588-Heterocapsa_arctica.AAC.1